jgi:hypothetical protein
VLARVREDNPFRSRWYGTVSDTLANIKALIDQCPIEQQRQVLAWLRKRYPIHALEETFGTTAEVILEAIARASDLSQRGVLGLIAEASFKINVIDRLGETDGLREWTCEPAHGDAAFDFRLRRGEEAVRIQVKRQRRESGKPKRYRGTSNLYVAETQRSRTGKHRKTGEGTRPYRFGEFDILAVSMQPVTGDWSCFRYTPERWLIPQPENPNLLKVLQPVSLEPNDDWTDSLATAIEWLRNGASRRIREA